MNDTAKKAIDNYKQKSEEMKAKIKSDPSKWRRFWKWILYATIWPFRYLWAECHDWKFFLLFVIVFLLVSSEVWVFYLLGFIFNGTNFGVWCLGIASACWLFWLGPFTPFTVICIAITFGLKALIDKITYRKRKEN